jgi:hypothetical protein
MSCGRRGVYLFIYFILTIKEGKLIFAVDNFSKELGFFSCHPFFQAMFLASILERVKVSIYWHFSLHFQSQVCLKIFYF